MYVVDAAVKHDHARFCCGMRFGTTMCEQSNGSCCVCNKTAAHAKLVMYGTTARPRAVLIDWLTSHRKSNWRWSKEQFGPARFS